MTREKKTAFKNNVGKGEIARNEQFLLFPQCSLLNQMIISPFNHIFDIISLLAAEFGEPKIGIIGISGKGLKFPIEILSAQPFMRQPFLSRPTSKLLAITQVLIGSMALNRDLLIEISDWFNGIK